MSVDAQVIAELHRLMDAIDADMNEKRAELRGLSRQYAAARLALLDLEAVLGVTS